MIRTKTVATAVVVATISVDPLLLALLKKIPHVEKGWPAAQRVRWVRILAMNVSQVYDGDDEPVEMKIDLEAALKVRRFLALL